MPASDDGLTALANAITRLSQRIGAMDANSRTAISGLKERIDEIEASLHAVPEPDGLDEARARSLESISAMVEQLAREIDNADETARSTVEGLRARVSSSLRREGDPIGNAIRALDARVSAMAERIKTPPPPAAPERSAKLDDLRGRLESLLARTPEPPPPPLDRGIQLESTLKALEDRIEAVKTRLATPPPPPPPPPPPAEVKLVRSPEDEERMRRMEARLEEISTKLSEPTPPPAQQDQVDALSAAIAEISARLSEPSPPPVQQEQVDELSAAIAEIADRQHSIDDRADAVAMRREQKAIADAVATLRSDVAGLVARVTTMSRNKSEEQEAYFTLARRIDALAAETPVDRNLLNGIRGEIDRVRALGEGGAREATVVSKLDELARKVPDNGRLDALGEELSAVRRAFDKADSPRSIGRLETRIGELARNVEAAVGSRKAETDNAATVSASLADVRRAAAELSAVSRRLDQASPAVAAVAGSLADIRGAIEQLNARQTDPAAEIVSGLSGSLASIRKAIDDLGATTRRIDPAASIATLSGSLAEIRRAIDELGSIRRPDDRGSPTVAGLTRTLSEIRSAIEDVGSLVRRNDPAGAVISALSGSLIDIRAAIDELTATRTTAGSSDRMASVVAESLAGIRMAIEDIASQRPADTANTVISSLTGSLSEIRSAIDELSETVQQADPARAAISGLSTSLADIRASVDELAANSRHVDISKTTVANLSNSLIDIRAAIDELAVSGRYGGSFGGANAAVSGLATTLDEIRHIIEAGDAAARRSEQVVVERLEARIDELTRRIEGAFDRIAPVDIVNGLHDRLEALVARFDAMNSDAPRASALEEIRREIAAIRHEVTDRAPPRFDDLEEQIRDLAGRLDEAARPDAAEAQLAELEAQVARLAAELEEAMPHGAALEQIEENLARLQTHLSDSRQESIEAAKTVARDAVRELAGGKQVDGELMRQLRLDLDRIRAASGDTDQRTQRTLQSLHGTLASIVDRLSRLESDARLEQRIAQSAPAEKASANLPMIGADTRTGAASTDAAAGLPGIAALRELAASSAEAQRDRAAGDRRADFIAAARRAAQAAVAEAEATVAKEEASVPSTSRRNAFARIGQAIRARKKPLLLAAAAIVLAIGALQLFGPPLGEERGNVAVAKATPPATVKPGRAAQPALPAVAMAIPASPLVAITPASTPTVPKVADSAMVPPTTDVKTALADPPPVAAHFGDDTAAPPPTDAFTQPDDAKPIPASVVSTDKSGATAGDSVEPDSAIGSDKLRAAASAGDPAAAFEIATRYAEGRGVAQNLATAADWYKRAAEGGVAVAQYRLGSLYERGQGVGKDLTAAVNWYQRAADQGNVGAMHNLAVLMSEGVDGPPDSAKALQWFLAAGNYGVKDSQYNLGVIYARGLGTDRDLIESYKWFAIAAGQGDNDAAQRRDEVGAMLSPDQLTKAKAAVQAWKAKPPLPEANGVSVPDGGWDSASVGLTDADRAGLVKKIQALLNEHGYDAGPADGVTGKKTRDAVKAFQHNLGVAETGQIDPSLMAALTQKD